MPPQRTETTRSHVQRCYPPLTIRARFSPERLISPPGTLTLRRTFPITESPHSISTHESTVAGTPEVRTAARTPVDISNQNDSGWGPTRSVPIPKPRGEVARLNRGGFNLKESLGWSTDVYDMVKVSGHTYRMTANNQVPELSSRSGQHTSGLG